MQSHFLRDQVSLFAPVIASVIASTIDRWQTTSESGGQVDIAVEMNRLTLDVIARTLFTKQLANGEINRMGDAITLLLEDMAGIQSAITGHRPSFSPQRNKSFRDAVTVIDEILLEMIEERRRDHSPSNDLLTSLISAANEQGQPMSDQEIRNEVITILVSGHETTAMSLSWAWYLLARHPQAEEQLHYEIDEQLEGRPPSVDDVPKLHWTTMVLKEAMRMYPPIWIIVKRALKPGEIAGIRIPAGDSVVTCLHTVHRHSDYWEAPNAFRPERFADSTGYVRYEDAYLPFGQGNHRCIGQHLSMLEQTMALAALAQRFRVRPVSDSVIKPLAGITLRMQSGFPARLERRCNQSSHT